MLSGIGGIRCWRLEGRLRIRCTSLQSLVRLGFRGALWPSR